MISNNISSIKPIPMTDRSIVASACSLGFSASFRATGLSGLRTETALLPLAGLPVPMGNERPTKALEAAVATAEAKAYAFAAASAGTVQQTHHHHTKWAFRGLKPWSDPA
ncbi:MULTISPECIES: hypothetical protein [Streptomyces]|uniref:hypothetical protein n=1 Tax=Streptomyces TaxID=1883 RepID=UPI002B1EDE66|nr:MULTISPECIES: hypothetical protein [Streptomyces]